MKSTSLKIAGEATMTLAELYSVLLQQALHQFKPPMPLQIRQCAFHPSLFLKLNSVCFFLSQTRCKSKQSGLDQAQTGIFHHNHDPLIATYNIKDRR
ncbi:hypothetical protein CsSME_00031695 [Camellia sinensis var. sinensis]